MYYISVCVTLLTILAGLHVWNKNKSQEHGALYKWMMYLVIGFAVLILICQISQGIMRMTCGDSCKPGKEMKMMRHHKMMMHHGKGDACCGGMMNKEDCEKHGADCDDDEECEGKENNGHENPNDSNTTSHE